MTTDAVGGVLTYASALARRLCEGGHEVTLVTMGPAPRREQVALLAGVPGLTLEINDLALEWMDPEGGDLPRARDTLRRVCDRVQPDIVHLNCFREATFDFGVPTLVAAHSCVGSWWQACRRGHAMEPRCRTYLRNVAAGLNAADVWTAPTLAYRDWIESFYRPRSRGFAVWNGAELPRRTGRKQNVILAAGRLWDEAKNLRLLAAIEADVPWPIRVAGPLQGADGSVAAPGGNLEHLGELPHAELLSEMQRSAVFAAPALYEPFGLGVLEAAGCGCALVLSDIATFRELWRGAALFVEPENPAALRDALHLLCRDDDLRRRLGAAARRRARRYSLDAMVRDYRRLYRDLTSATGRPRARSAPALETRP
jgi:glycosyltransferase involved in cell wall biosynthesis